MHVPPSIFSPFFVVPLDLLFVSLHSRYTLIGAHEIDGVKLIQLRNPWGKFEWTGKWADNDAAWDEHPNVKQQLNPTFEDDGIFFMSYEDFEKNYKKVDVCMREVTASTDLFLDVQEEDGALGPTKACGAGCYKYLTGGGCRVTCGGRQNKDDQRRLAWYNRNATFLWEDLKARRASRPSTTAVSGADQV